MTRRGRTAFLGASAVLVVVAAWARWPAVDPLTLWYDDVWVAALAAASDWPQTLTTMAPTPPGFLLLVRGARAFVGDIELGSQLVPLGCALLAIPLAGLISARLTESWLGGFVGATLVALDPRLAQQSVHVKQYAVEALVVTLLFGAFVVAAAQRRPSGASWRPWLPIAAGATLPLMISGNLGAVPLVNAYVLLVARAETGRRRIATLLAGLLYDLAAVAIGLLVYVPRRTEWLGAYWSENFLPLTAGGDTLPSSGSVVVQSLTQATPSGLPWLAFFVVPGLVALFRSKQRRPVGWLVLLLWAAALTGAALGLHPIGSRIDVYSGPLTLTLIAVGIVASFRLLSDRAARASLIATAVALGALALLQPPRPIYFDSPLSRRIAEMFEELRPDDGLIIYPESSWVVALYSGLPVFFDNTELDGDYHALPIARIERPNTHSIRAAPRGTIYARLDDFIVRGGYPRIFYFGSRMRIDTPDAPIIERIRGRGYRLERDRRSMLNTPGARRQDAGAMLFVRTGGPFDARPPRRP